MFEEIIINQNKHWTKKPQKLGSKREKFEELISKLETKHIISILGIRRCGKSTLLKQLINYLVNSKNINPKNILFMNLEDTYLYKYRREPEYLDKIYEEYLNLTQEVKGKRYILLDEIQFFENWQIFLKKYYELSNVKFIITGSNSKLISDEISTALTGRVLKINLNPFNLREILKSKNIKFKNKIDLINNKTKIKHEFEKYSLNGNVIKLSFF
jgi:uncharacterized protein